MNKRRHVAPGLFSMLALISGLMLVASAPVAAGEFVINPLRVSLDRSTRAAEVVVRNDDKVPLRMQVEAMSWSQGGEGPDKYAPAEGLLYFPRTMEIPPGDSRVVRVGIRAAPVTREEAYRLFIEELPPATSADEPAPGTSLRVFLRVGVAVFVAPAQPERKGEIARLDLKGRQVEWVVVNNGNVHFRADQVELVGIARDGTRLFVQPFQERYFLAGVTRTLRFDIAPEACRQLATVEAVVVADRLDLKRRIDVPPGSCK
jgi:fimbrial chaperone protein